MRPTGRLVRAEIEARARRLAAAVIAAHATCDERVHARTGDAEAREALAERVEDLGAIAQLLPAVHPLRMAAEHAREVHQRWMVDPPAEALMMALSLALLGRVVNDTDTAFSAAA